MCKRLGFKRVFQIVLLNVYKMKGLFRCVNVWDRYRFICHSAHVLLNLFIERSAFFILYANTFMLCVCARV
jgi:hypothetical protein